MYDEYDYDPTRDVMPRARSREESFVEFLDRVAEHWRFWAAAAIGLPAAVGIIVAFNCLLNTTP